MLDPGADQALLGSQSTEVALGENAVDVVVDLVGCEEWPELLNILQPFGRYAVSGVIAGPIIALDLRTLYSEHQRFMGRTVLHAGVFSRRVSLIERGEIMLLLARSFDL